MILTGVIVLFVVVVWVGVLFMIRDEDEFGN